MTTHRSRAAFTALTLAALLLAAPAHAQQADRDCPDFASQAEAQAAFDAVAGDPERLDRDGDGIACEDPDDTGALESGVPPETPTSTPTPSRIDTGGGGAAPERGSAAAIAAAVTALVGLGVAGHLRRSRQEP